MALCLKAQRPRMILSQALSSRWRKPGMVKELRSTLASSRILSSTYLMKRFSRSRLLLPGRGCLVVSSGPWPGPELALGWGPASASS
eukprot:CAMPEP_0175582114 /NCGR_PEP_ID=MMETSP0096-20121207/47972_1 /TAXON_ID=311494 /ORGANISM="Alexandrium monilatum, Strain CCMP3105" /LENGTH=86 /DNA_ID=CAMNT_0016885781 /DNA_START=155 /DNA_END=412 /DNA_ORIENTATION=+